MSKAQLNFLRSNFGILNASAKHVSTRYFLRCLIPWIYYNCVKNKQRNVYKGYKGYYFLYVLKKNLVCYFYILKSGMQMRSLRDGTVVTVLAALSFSEEN